MQIIVKTPIGTFGSLQSDLNPEQLENLQAALQHACGPQGSYFSMPTADGWMVMGHQLVANSAFTIVGEPKDTK